MTISVNPEVLLVESLVAKLVGLGLTQVVVCAGARNALLIKAFQRVPGLKLWNHPDERSAAFFALGLNGPSTQGQAAVLTTSGTAVSECYSAVIEAYYQKIPLLVISADRPKEFRGSGAPQAIEQKNIFGSYATCLDICETSEVEHIDLNTSGPLHLNICLDEPQKILKNAPQNLFVNLTQLSLPSYQSPEDLAGEYLEQSTDTLKADKALAITQPLVLVGPLLRAKSKSQVREFLNKVKALIYIEGAADLVGYQHKTQVFCLEAWIEEAVSEGFIRSVVKLGNTPLTRFWRDLEQKYPELEVWSFSENELIGLARPVTFNGSLADITRVHIADEFNRQDLLKIMECDRQAVQIAEQLAGQFPNAEVAIVGGLKKLKTVTHWYLGNSLPIRHWDWAPDINPPVGQVWASRGANGIDGQLSTFWGWVAGVKQARPYEPIRAGVLVGDLTAFYDLQSLWWAKAVSELLSPEDQVTLWILNNQGGQIFKNLVESPLVINSHKIDFSAWAKMFELPFFRARSCQELKPLTSAPGSDQIKIVELLPSVDAGFNLDQKWKEALLNIKANL